MVGRKILTVNVEVHEDHKVSLLIAGNTYNFRTRLDEYDVPQGKIAGEGESVEYFRVLSNIDLDNDEQRRRAINMFQTVFSNLAMRLVVPQAQPQECKSRSGASAFISDLRSLNLFDM